MKYNLRWALFLLSDDTEGISASLKRIFCDATDSFNVVAGLVLRKLFGLDVVSARACDTHKCTFVCHLNLFAKHVHTLYK